MLPEHHRPFLCCLGIVAVQLALLYGYVESLQGETVWGVVGDDPWIHLAVARDLSQRGLIHGGLGPWGGGITSLLWVLLLAAGYRLAGAMVPVAWGWGALSLIAATVLLFDVMRGARGPGKGMSRSLLVAGLFGTSGMVLSAALSGMEALLFVALGLSAIWAFARRRLVLASVSLGLLALARIEGLALVFLLAAVYLWACRHEGLRHHLGDAVRLFGAAGGLVLSGMLFSWWTTGTPLPTTLQGRKWLWWRGTAHRVILLNGDTARHYVANWFRYLDGWLFSTYPLADTGVPGAALRLLFWLLLAAGLWRWIQYTLRWLRDARLDGRVALPLLLGWTVGHNLGYLWFAPVPSLRHQPVNMVFAAVCLGLGCDWAWSVLGRLWPRGSTRLSWLAAVGLLLYTLPSNSLWRWRHVTHVRHTNDVHVRMALWVSEHLPPGTPVAAFDIGALAYFGQHEVIDLSGLTDPRYTNEVILPGRVLAFLEDREVRYLVIPSSSESQGLMRDLGLYDEAFRARFRGRELQRVTYPLYMRPPFDRAAHYFYPIALGLSLYELEW